MLRKTYDNAVVTITKPTKEQQENIKKAIERFAKQLAKEGLIDQNGYKHSGEDLRKE